MYHTSHRKTRNRTEEKQLLKGVAIFLLLALGAVIMILGRIIT